jgi:beta-galactosidase
MKSPFFAASVCMLSLSSLSLAQNRTEFALPFAPSEGFVKAPERPTRQEISLNGRWQFQPIAVPAGFQRDTGIPPELAPPNPENWEKMPIKIPSPWNVNTWGNGRDTGEGSLQPYVADSLYYPSYPAQWDGVEMGWLRRSFAVPANWENRRIMLHFEAVAGQAQILVNGKPAGQHFDSFLPFDLDITALVRRGSANELLVGVRKSSLFDIASANYTPDQRRTYPNGSNMDNLVGIWNDVSLLGLPPVRVADAFIKPQVGKGLLQAELTLRNDSRQAQRIQVGGDIKPWGNLAGKDILSAPVPKWRLGSKVLSFPVRQALVPAGGTAKVTLQVPVGTRLKLWSPDAPHLYGAVFQLKQVGATTAIDQHYVRFGWREFRIKGRNLTLNGKNIQLTGDFMHPFGPYMSSRRYVWQFYKTIKDMGGNSTRPHAQLHPRAYLDLADEMGLCVLDEASIFGSSINLNLKEEITWQRLEKHVDGMVVRDRNHASVFGWSPGNEMFALFFKTAKEERDREYLRLKSLARRPLALDPTRNWVSVDGDSDLEGTLPVWSRHLGIGLPGKDTFPQPDNGKPRMIGEHGGTYYASPPRLEEINGDKSYESYQARNEALAIDLYRMITTTARKELAFFSPSELGWFGLEHLPFGYRDHTRPPSKSDGVFFSKYAENQPGVQIERLPPYAMTLNPGFDQNLPAYKPMAMFEAMKAALRPANHQPSRWSQIPKVVKRAHPAPTNLITKVAFAGDFRGELYETLSVFGIPLAAGADAATASMLIIDGESLSQTTAPAANRLAREILGRGGMVWGMMRDQGRSLPQLAGLLPSGLTLTDRHATSLVRGQSSPTTAGFSLDQLYFVGEGDDSQIQKAGLTGPLVQGGKVLLSASNSDWSLFDRRSESSKGSSMLIYENLQKPAGAALVEVPQGAGRLWISTLDTAPSNKLVETFWKQLFANIGVKVTPLPRKWLVQAGRDANVEWKYTLAQPLESWATSGFDDSAWTVGRSGFGGPVPKAEPHTPWSSGDIYLRKEFTLDQIPANLNLLVHHDEDVDIYLNGTLIFKEGNFTTDYKNVPLEKEALEALRVGKNVLAVHCHQTAGGQFLDVGLVSGGLPPRGEGASHDLLLDGPLGTN